ncbi:SGNH/GDSL hydrolase family protein [Sporosarcina pasteurii]|uniref:SGNH hydrolase-type esterase domain-containing protein n=1 Tax=Sporosarcina pasteurii TaxID=1474 RepID=A0A380BEL3_SPOPA|nr:SGNH/GDSL hydrolase family protein [Sporosarcina pasteurii]MDS9472222.1 SGNH/GDSL hydrolase family protein [Sporosarcina pasteurii]QBQ06207.1 SGNH/GDSL hydrolase family protein [Sporosarcina pasteurii]SUI99181.1 Uncharacterised protein [Sporosarcina pasteurii]
MTKKTIFAYIVLIGCIVLLAGSYLQWKEKLSSFHGDTAKTAASNDNKKTASDDSDKSKSIDERERLLSLIKHQDEAVQAVFLNRFDDGEPVKFLLVGSNVMEDGNPGYAERLDNALKKIYGTSIETTIISYNGTSDKFMNDAEIDFAEGYDVILFEPFTLKNNGNVTIEDERAHILQFHEQLVSAVEDAVLILHPPQPVHNARYYPTQIDSLQAFAKENNFPYINHWADWPDFDSDEFLDYVNEDGAPNNEGADIWANALIEYFIAEKMEEE